MSALAAEWVVAFSAAVAATGVCSAAYTAHQYGREFVRTVEENEQRSLQNRYAIHESECIELPGINLEAETTDRHGGHET